MDAVDVIAVVGACGPERQEYARRLARATKHALISASRLAGSPHPAEEAAILASWTDPAAGTVVELPDEVQATELIGAFADHDDRTRLLDLVCVIDAAHVLDDMHREDRVPLRDAESGIPSPLVARAQLTAWQIEYASTLMLVNWSGLPSPELTAVMALLNHLSPRARLRLHRGVIDQVGRGEAYSVEQDRAGWMGLLNGDFDPHLTDRRVSALRYEHVRPMHPGRLQQLLDAIADGAFGHVVRSAGFCRLATRQGLVAQWDHVGRVLSFDPVAADGRLEDEEELLALGQDLAFLGLDLDHRGLTTALDRTALTDDEFAAGPAAWAAFTDPFPAWVTVTERSE